MDKLANFKFSKFNLAQRLTGGSLANACCQYTYYIRDTFLDIELKDAVSL